MATQVLSETEVKVQEWLTYRKVDYRPIFMPSDQSSRKMAEVQIHWRLFFSGPGRNGFDTSFHQGHGHLPKRKKVRLASWEAPVDLKRWIRTMCDRGTDGSRTHVIPPTAASVLSCLLSDAQAGDMKFGEFCSEFGYDSDSIKALETHRACEKMEKDMRHFFTREELTELRDMLQDY